MIVAAGIVGGGVFLATWDIPSPSEQIAIPVSDDKLPK